MHFTLRLQEYITKYVIHKCDLKCFTYKLLKIVIKGAIQIKHEINRDLKCIKKKQQKYKDVYQKCVCECEHECVSVCVCVCVSVSMSVCVSVSMSV